MKEFRFAVGQVDGNRSGSWKLWTQGDEAYLLQHGVTARHHKFSFHKTGNCRWALINPKLTGSERAILEWTRDPVPEVGSGQGCLLLSVTFPTNHLSTSREIALRKLHWIDRAPTGWAVHVELVLTQESQPKIIEWFDIGHHRRLLAYLRLRSGMHVCAAASVHHCGPVELRIPGKPVKPGQVFGEMYFPDKDEQNIGRPIRLVMMRGSTTPPDVWELGGREVTPLALL
jgi:hypothetical protein